MLQPEKKHDHEWQSSHCTRKHWKQFHQTQRTFVNTEQMLTHQDDFVKSMQNKLVDGHASLAPTQPRNWSFMRENRQKAL